MATADRRVPARVWFAGFLALAVLGVAVIWWQTARDATSTAASASAAIEPRAVFVDAESIYQFDTLAEMAEVSDLVVEGRVVDVTRGRTIGQPGDSAITSRIVTISVDATFPETTDAPATVLVEEEGWLSDGSPLVVNGVSPSEIGDSGIWFLDELGDPELPAYLVINSQGRFLHTGDEVSGGDQRDPLVQTLQTLGYLELRQAVVLASKGL
jgi:hypothetical protein